MTMNKYGTLRTIDGEFAEVEARVRGALKNQGFGVIAEIDMQKAMKEKLGIDYPPYRILGACNPSLAHRGLTAEPALGLLLPCNVIVRQAGDKIEVGIVDAGAMLSVVGNPALTPVAEEAKMRLEKALAAV